MPGSTPVPLGDYLHTAHCILNIAELQGVTNCSSPMVSGSLDETNSPWELLSDRPCSVPSALIKPQEAVRCKDQRPICMLWLDEILSYREASVSSTGNLSMCNISFLNGRFLSSGNAARPHDQLLLSQQRLQDMFEPFTFRNLAGFTTEQNVV